MRISPGDRSDFVPRGRFALFDLRRVADIVVAGAALAFLAPVIAAIAVSIRVTMGSPVLFRQQRAGRYGVEFEILKFRTMRPAACPGQPDRDRVTWLGRLLRSASLDELPQLVNILRGEMSLIGPRPTLPSQVRYYDERQRGRLAVRPGLTGWAQVNGRNSVSWPERIELDLWYIDNRSWSLDLEILAATVGCLLRPRGVVGECGVNPEFPRTEPAAAAVGETSPPWTPTAPPAPTPAPRAAVPADRS